MKANAAQLPRLDRVISCLQQSIDVGGPLPDLDALAAIAHYSPFHFHRVYRALTGETIGRTVQRLRVVKALQRLAHSDASVTEIALLAGYDTPQALARVLRETVDASASELRGDPQRLAASIEQLQQLIGVPLGDHRELPAEELLFNCALAFDAELPVLPASLQRLVLGGGRMARLRHVGSYVLLEDATDQLLRDWLPGSGHALRDAPLHYHFLDDPEEVPEAILRADIYVPLAAG